VAGINEEDEGLQWQLPSQVTSSGTIDTDSVLSEQYNGTADVKLLKAVKKHRKSLRDNNYEEVAGIDDENEAEEFVTRSKQYRYKIRQLRRLAEYLQMLAQRNRDTVLGLIPEIRRLESKVFHFRNILLLFFF
jgi:hypothetical protein